MKLFRDGILVLGLIKKIVFVVVVFFNFMQNRCIILLKGNEFGFVNWITPLWWWGGGSDKRPYKLSVSVGLIGTLMFL